jgi:hypothetical protein
MNFHQKGGSLSTDLNLRGWPHVAGRVTNRSER